MRRAYIDWARGLAVLVMIEAHTLDAWTRDLDRSTIAFRYLTILGGFAAPLFLFLAGVALALTAARRSRDTSDRWAPAAAVVQRGLEVFVLAFLFRLQALIVTPGSPVIMLFRVDVLNIMGVSIAAAGLLYGLAASRTRMTIASAALAAAIALSTPVIRAALWVDSLPVWLQWYVRPAGEYTTFTLFPWAGFVFAGSAIGAVLAWADNSRRERSLPISIAAAGLGLVAIGFVTSELPTIYASSSFWTSSPAFFAIRAGTVMLVFAAFQVFATVAPGAGHRLFAEPLERLGRRSLFVYWIHVELVYGYATWPLRHRLALWQLAVCYVTFCALMYAAVVFRDRAVQRRRTRSSARSPYMIVS